MGKSAKSAAVSPPAVRRTRRPTQEIRVLILQGARAIFAELGFAGATTRLIARRAGVAEPLIFGNFGTKAALFTEAVIAPFNQNVEIFLQAGDPMPSEPAERSARFVHGLYPFLRENADLLHAMLKSGTDTDGATRHGLDNYFEQAVARMQSHYISSGLTFDVAPELTVRYAFGMLAGAVLFGDWFFPETGPSKEEAEQALARLIFKAAAPASE